MSEVVAKNEKESKTPPWYSELWVVVLILSFPTIVIAGFWLRGSIPLAITCLLILNITFWLMPQENRINSRIKNKYAQVFILNILFVIFLSIRYLGDSYLAEFIKIPPTFALTFGIFNFFFLVGLMFYWITKSPKR